jgi:hypothetical protein
MFSDMMSEMLRLMTFIEKKTYKGAGNFHNTAAPKFPSIFHTKGPVKALEFL